MPDDNSDGPLRLVSGAKGKRADRDAAKDGGKRADRGGAKEGGKRAGGANNQIDPDAPYEDPQGRKVMPRHKRMAMRRAKSMGLSPKSGNHALHLLAAEGIDILEGDDTMLAIAEKSGEEESNLPATRKGKAISKAEAQSLDEEREQAISKIQADLVRRRRRRFMSMLLRLTVFVFLPTAIVGYYYFNIATPMYETNSEFVIQTSENPAAGGGGLGALLAGTGFATSQDSIVVQGYLSSREAFLRLNEDHEYVRLFQDPRIDYLQRLPEDATTDDAYAFYRDKVTIGYDPTEGIIRMSVVAPTAEASQRFSEALISYAEARVDGLTQEARGDQLQVAVGNYEDAQAAMNASARRVLALQQQRGVLSADVELQSTMGIINSLELERERKRLELLELKDNARPNDARVGVLEREIARLGDTISERRDELTQTSESSTSLARIGGELRIAESDLEMRVLMLQQAITSMETARLEASRQVRYLSLGVSPVAPVKPTYPREIEGTFIAFLMFMGIYIMVSLTVSILREQVSV